MTLNADVADCHELCDALKAASVAVSPTGLLAPSMV